MRKKSTEQVLTETTSQLAKDIEGLSDRRRTALGIFRDTAENLAAINEDLNKSITNFDNLTKFIMEQKLSAEQMVSDNDKVRNKILEILGD